jgi:quercetin dioxygenase-like cupin family protein
MNGHRRDLLKWAAGLNGLALLGANAPSIPNAVVDEKQAKLTREPFGDLRIYFEGSTGQVKSMTAGSLRLKPGMSPHPPHQHPEEEFMVITEGSGEITVDGATTKVGPGSMMYCAAGKLHGIVNTGKSPLLFYFYKWQA